MATLAISNKPWNSNGGNSYLPCQTQTSSTATWHLQGMHFFLDSFHNLFQGLGSRHRCIHPPSAKGMEPRISILEYLGGGGGVHPLRFFKYYTSVRNCDFMPYLSSQLCYQVAWIAPVTRLNSLDWRSISSKSGATSAIVVSASDLSEKKHALGQRPVIHQIPFKKLKIRKTYTFAVAASV